MRGWFLPAVVIVAVEYVVALSVGFTIGFHRSIAFSSYLISGLLVAAVSVCVISAYRLATKSQRPASDLVEVVAVVVLVGLQMAVLGWLKVMLPHAQPFWADPMLAQMDAAMFGTDPWRITHFLFGWATPVIDRAYVTWAPLKFAVLLCVALAPPSILKARAILSYFLMVASSAVGQYSLSSAGPVFYERFGFGDRFADLPLEPWVNIASVYLWQGYQQPTAHMGAGISAMPSLHVAIALWIALVTRAYLPKFQALGWAYFALILVGSVHLGWHYAMDSIIAVGIGLAAWSVASVPQRRLVSVAA